jgi:hypothetical protein
MRIQLYSLMFSRHSLWYYNDKLQEESQISTEHAATKLAVHFFTSIIATDPNLSQKAEKFYRWSILQYFMLLKSKRVGRFKSAVSILNLRRRASSLMEPILQGNCNEFKVSRL